jgi:hypothetical protein
VEAAKGRLPILEIVVYKFGQLSQDEVAEGWIERLKTGLGALGIQFFAKEGYH